MKDLSNENIVHVKSGNVEYIQFKKLLGYSDVLTHCFTLRDLDFAGFDSYEENKEKVEESYQKICNELNIQYSNLCRPKQTHTNIVKDILDADEGIYHQKFYDVDGLITNKKNKALVLAFADCTPLLFFDPVKKVIANTHSGWRGTLQRISIKTVEKMKKEFSCNPEDIICCIAPSIRKCHFEVEKDVKDMFETEFQDLEKLEEIIEEKIPNKKWNIDTVLINQIILQEKGLKKENIIDSGICSVCNSDLIHSYRVEKQGYGLSTACIQLN